MRKRGNIVGQPKRMAAVLLVVIAAGACAGGKDGGERAADADGPGAASTEEQGGNSTASSPSKASSPKNGSAPGAGSGPANSKTSGAQPSTGDVTAAPPVALEVVLGSACVKAGETQTITINAPGNSAVGYDTYYADGKSGLSDGFYGGNNGRVMPPEGTWTDTWLVEPTAPPGRTKVVVQAARVGNKAAMREAYFELVAATGVCP